MANYQVIAREMKGTSVTGYILDNGNAKMRVDLDQMAFLVGRSLVENCEGKLFRDTLMIGGINGLKLNKLPSIKSKDTDDNKVKGSYTVSDNDINSEPEILYNITGVVKKGRVTVAYDTDTKGEVLREQVVKDAVDDKIGNLTTQMYNGNVLLRGVGINLKSLPVRQVEDKSKTGKKSVKTAESTSMDEVVKEALKEITSGPSSKMISEFAYGAHPEESTRIGDRYNKNSLTTYVVDFGGYDKEHSNNDSYTARVIIRHSSKNKAEITIGFRVYGDEKGELKDRISNKFGLTMNIEANNIMIRANIEKLTRSLKIDEDEAFNIQYRHWLETTRSAFERVGMNKIATFMGGKFTKRDDSIVEDVIELVIDSEEKDGMLPARTASFMIYVPKDAAQKKRGKLSCSLNKQVSGEGIVGSSIIEVDIKTSTAGIESDVISVINMAIKDLNLGLSNDPNRENNKELVKLIQVIKRDFLASNHKDLLREYVGLKAGYKPIENTDSKSCSVSYVYSNNMNGKVAMFSVTDDNVQDGKAKIMCSLENGNNYIQRERIIHFTAHPERIKSDIDLLIDETLTNINNSQNLDNKMEEYRQAFISMDMKDKDINIDVEDVIKFDNGSHLIPLKISVSGESGRYVPLKMNIEFNKDGDSIEYQTLETFEASIKLVELLNKAVNRGIDQDYVNLTRVVTKKFISGYSKLVKNKSRG